MPWGAGSPMQHFKVRDCVLVINAAYDPGLIGHVGTVERVEEQVSGIDRFGRLVSGVFVVVDLPGDVNRHGTTLWYLRPEYLIKLSPPDHVLADEALIGVGADAPTLGITTPGELAG